MRRMHPVMRLIVVLGVLGWLPGCTVPPLMHRGGIMVDSWAEVKIDNATAAGILAAFNRAGTVLQAGHLDELRISIPSSTAITG